MDYVTTCSCGKINVSASFPLPLEQYQARQCDCDFCVAHGLAYLSDANGTISFSAKEKMNQLKQGSEQATFWQCSNCKDIVVVTHSQNAETRGAVSKSLFAQKYKLKPSITVSPKKLSPSEKSERWSAAWSKVV